MCNSHTSAVLAYKARYTLTVGVDEMLEKDCCAPIYTETAASHRSITKGTPLTTLLKYVRKMNQEIRRALYLQVTLAPAPPAPPRKSHNF